MKIKNIGSLLAASTILVSSGAFAADQQTVLSGINGEVLVNQGESYLAAQEGMHLKAGDQLMVMEGGQASIEYVDGCLHKVDANEMMRIDAVSPCVLDTNELTGPVYTQNTGSYVGPLVAAGTVTVVIASTGGDRQQQTISP